MTHPEEQLSGYVDGTLGTDERAEVDAHLATCATCREEIELSTRAVTMLRELPEMPVALASAASLLRCFWGAVSPICKKSPSPADQTMPLFV